MADKIIINPPKNEEQRKLWEEEICKLLGRQAKQIADLEERVTALEGP